MKKIDIITFHSAYNYGAMLQTFALQKYLKKNYCVKIINFRTEAIDNPYRLFNLSKKRGIKNVKTIISSCIYFFKNYKRNKSFVKFMNDNYDLTKKYDTEESLKKHPPKADVYITGSDQVWNTSITEGLRDSYTLNFGPSDTRRISYAASIGKAKIEEIEKSDFQKKISNIDYISVREETARNCLKDIEINKKIDVVLDPTLLIEKKEWEQLVSNFSKEYGKYIFAYYVEEDDDYYDVVNELSEKTGYSVIYINKKRGKLNRIMKNCYTGGPIEFISLIKNAEYIVTTSFHATVFSIIFNKKFWTIPNKKTGNRVTDLLAKLDLSNRAINNIEEFSKINNDLEIDWKTVNNRLELERKKSIDWLIKSIEK